MLTTYEQIDDLKPWHGWNREQITKLRLMLRTSLDGHLNTRSQLGTALAQGDVETMWCWYVLPGLQAQYELDLAESLYLFGPTRELGLWLGRMLSNDLKPGMVDLVMALVQSSTARTFMQLYREFISAGELKLADVI